MNKTYYQMCMELGAAHRNLEKVVHKNWPAIKEVLVAGKQVLKATVQMAGIKANVSFYKECWKNGYVNTIVSGMDGSTVGYNGADEMH